MYASMMENDCLTDCTTDVAFFTLLLLKILVCWFQVEDKPIGPLLDCSLYCTKGI